MTGLVARWQGSLRHAAAPGLVGGLAILAAVAPLAAQFAMPDPRQMAGIPRPVDDLPDRSISVRLIRGQLSNNITRHPVELHVEGGRVMIVNTDDTGRAQFDDVTAGSRVHAVAIVEGERLESQPFVTPAKGGIRLLLVATDKAAGGETRQAAPVRAGEVVFGENSRVLVEMGDDGLRVFYLFEVINSSPTPVDGNGPLVIDAPDGAQGLSLLEESSRQATVAGGRITITGPFQPGSTPVQAAFQLPVTSGSVSIAQALPASVSAFVVIVQKVAGLELVSAQLADRREMTTPEGQAYIIARGSPLAPGERIAFELRGLPHHSRWPAGIALTLAGVVIVLGVWFGRPREQSADKARRAELFARREQLLDRLVALDREGRGGRIPAERFGVRRDELIRSLERVYGELDSSPGAGAPDEGPAR
jgi:hypothetical protein